MMLRHDLVLQLGTGGIINFKLLINYIIKQAKQHIHSSPFKYVMYTQERSQGGKGGCICPEFDSVAPDFIGST